MHLMAGGAVRRSPLGVRRVALQTVALTRYQNIGGVAGFASVVTAQAYVVTAAAVETEVTAVVKATLRVPVAGQFYRVNTPAIDSRGRASIGDLMAGDTAGIGELITRLAFGFLAATAQSVANARGCGHAFARQSARFLLHSFGPQYGVGELTNEMRFHRFKGCASVAVRQFNIRIERVKVELVAATALAIHRDGFEVLAIVF